MNIHLLKCKFNLHDYKHKKEKHENIILYKKECIWCGETETYAEKLL